ncbi:MAG: DnaJ domain-containing protein [Bacteroidetes bacterium]|nr:DnaJ domain-containing protein [Bacteroidota bacterium]
MMPDESEDLGSDYYEILGVQPDATADELLAAYRYRAYMLHPDRMLDASQLVRINAERDFEMVNEAWAVLSNPERRRAYDESRRQQAHVSAEGNPPSADAASTAPADIPRSRRADAKAFNDEGIALAELGRWDAARLCFDRALEADESLADAWINKGVSLDNLHRWDDAIQCYDRALGIDCSLVGAWYNKGVALRSLGRMEEAEHCFARARDPLGVTELWADRRSVGIGEDQARGSEAGLGAPRPTASEHSEPRSVSRARSALIILLKVFGMLWLLGVVIVVGYIGVLLAAGNLWAGWLAVTNGPVPNNLLRWMGIILVTSPGLGSLWLAVKLERRPDLIGSEAG